MQVVGVTIADRWKAVAWNEHFNIRFCGWQTPEFYVGRFCVTVKCRSVERVVMAYNGGLLIQSHAQLIVEYRYQYYVHLFANTTHLSCPADFLILSESFWEQDERLFPR